MHDKSVFPIGTGVGYTYSVPRFLRLSDFLRTLLSRDWKCEGDHINPSHLPDSTEVDSLLTQILVVSLDQRICTFTRI